eukprot:TRINITY_DN1985_c0_g5_i1.p1 TRINITY_DN1985_c0_g5~~TRINITY_DN1985_c0_g5_i1.p1  ORF type:complete len:1645 (+),score=440.27 TRINITY_DN1985_c0_g5_i1:323-4936(+)
MAAQKDDAAEELQRREEEMESMAQDVGKRARDAAQRIRAYETQNVHLQMEVQRNKEREEELQRQIQSLEGRVSECREETVWVTQNASVTLKEAQDRQEEIKYEVARRLEEERKAANLLELNPRQEGFMTSFAAQMGNTIVKGLQNRMVELNEMLDANRQQIKELQTFKADQLQLPPQSPVPPARPRAPSVTLGDALSSSRASSPSSLDSPEPESFVAEEEADYLHQPPEDTYFRSLKLASPCYSRVASTLETVVVSGLAVAAVSAIYMQLIREGWSIAPETLCVCLKIGEVEEMTTVRLVDRQSDTATYEADILLPPSRYGSVSPQRFQLAGKSSATFATFANRSATLSQADGVSHRSVSGSCGGAGVPALHLEGVRGTGSHSFLHTEVSQVQIPIPSEVGEEALRVPPPPAAAPETPHPRASPRAEKARVRHTAAQKSLEERKRNHSKRLQEYEVKARKKASVKAKEDEQRRVGAEEMQRRMEAQEIIRKNLTPQITAIYEERKRSGKAAKRPGPSVPPAPQPKRSDLYVAGKPGAHNAVRPSPKPVMSEALNAVDGALAKHGAGSLHPHLMLRDQIQFSESDSEDADLDQSGIAPPLSRDRVGSAAHQAKLGSMLSWEALQDLHAMEGAPAPRAGPAEESMTSVVPVTPLRRDAAVGASTQSTATDVTHAGVNKSKQAVPSPVVTEAASPEARHKDPEEPTVLTVAEKLQRYAIAVAKGTGREALLLMGNDAVGKVREQSARSARGSSLPGVPADDAMTQTNSNETPGRIFALHHATHGTQTSEAVGPTSMAVQTSTVQLASPTKGLAAKRSQRMSLASARAASPRSARSGSPRTRGSPTFSQRTPNSPSVIESFTPFLHVKSPARHSLSRTAHLQRPSTTSLAGSQRRGGSQASGSPRHSRSSSPRSRKRSSQPHYRNAQRSDEPLGEGSMRVRQRREEEVDCSSRSGGHAGSPRAAGSFRGRTHPGTRAASSSTVGPGVTMSDDMNESVRSLGMSSTNNNNSPRKVAHSHSHSQLQQHPSALSMAASMLGAQESFDRATVASSADHLRRARSGVTDLSPESLSPLLSAAPGRDALFVSSGGRQPNTSRMASQASLDGINLSVSAHSRSSPVKEVAGFHRQTSAFDDVSPSDSPVHMVEQQDGEAATIDDISGPFRDILQQADFKGAWSRGRPPQLPPRDNGSFRADASSPKLPPRDNGSFRADASSPKSQPGQPPYAGWDSFVFGARENDCSTSDLLSKASMHDMRQNRSFSQRQTAAELLSVASHPHLPRLSAITVSDHSPQSQPVSSPFNNTLPQFGKDDCSTTQLTLPAVSPMTPQAPMQPEQASQGSLASRGMPPRPDSSNRLKYDRAQFLSDGRQSDASNLGSYSGSMSPSAFSMGRRSVTDLERMIRLPPTAVDVDYVDNPFGSAQASEVGTPSRRHHDAASVSTESQPASTSYQLGGSMQGNPLITVSGVDASSPMTGADRANSGGGFQSLSVPSMDSSLAIHQQSHQHMHQHQHQHQSQQQQHQQLSLPPQQQQLQQQQRRRRQE